MTKSVVIWVRTFCREKRTVEVFLSAKGFFMFVKVKARSPENTIIKENKEDLLWL